MTAQGGPAPDRVAALVRIRGRVQGVGYRYWTETEARALGLSGHVRNLTDGSVEALLIGETHAVARMLSRCEDGPAAAAVTAVETTKLSDADLARIAGAPPAEAAPQGFRRRPTGAP